jgi:preprotein translocase subunit SecA
VVLGSVTLQHLMERYGVLAGMTATAYPACQEFHEFYGLTTVVVPPNRASVRTDHPDRVFGSKRSKLRAMIDEIVSVHATGRPVLVGTASVAESEQLAASLGREGLACRVLNARNDEQEAAIVAQAGSPGALTISTNMAGRGTDIRLGGADENRRDEVVGLGGLHVIGTNRHESRRIDDQLRGRAGRQGDPGSTRFFVSLEDPLLERFDLLQRLPRAPRPSASTGDSGREHQDPLVLREVERTQRIVEGQNLDIRRTLSRYSEMVEQQRLQLHLRREAVLHGNTESFLANRSDRYDGLTRRYGSEFARRIERRLTLALIDRAWSDHLAFVTELRDAIHLRNVARLDPLAEFQHEVIEAFADLVRRLDEELVETFESAAIGPQGIDLESMGLRAPSSTWTYIISDDPFRDQLFSKIGGTTMGLGIVFNFPLVLLWAVYRKWRLARDRASSDRSR